MNKHLNDSHWNPSDTLKWQRIYLSNREDIEHNFLQTILKIVEHVCESDIRSIKERTLLRMRKIWRRHWTGLRLRHQLTKELLGWRWVVQRLPARYLWQCDNEMPSDLVLVCNTLSPANAGSKLGALGCSQACGTLPHCAFSQGW